jgi:hypothetical protein
MDEIIIASDTNYDYLQLKTYETLKQIEEDIRPPLVKVKEKPYQSWLSRLFTDILGVSVGYIGFFFILNFIRSGITRTPLYSWYWMYFGPWYYFTKAPLLTNEWQAEESLLQDAEGNTCLQDARNNFENCRNEGGSLFKCTSRKVDAELDCLVYTKCSTESVTTMVELFINYVPEPGYDAAKSLMDKLRWLNPMVGIIDVAFTDNIPEFTPRPSSGHKSLNPDQRAAMRSDNTINDLKALCMEKDGTLGLKVKGLSYDDIQKYFDDNFENLK